MSYQPHLIDLVQELRRELGLFDGAMPIAPKEAWEQALAEVRRLRAPETPKLCDACLRDEHHPDKLVKGCPCPCNPREVH